MKKLSIFMLCCVLLLSGCAGGSQQPSDSGESAESFISSAEQSTTSSALTTPKQTTSTAAAQKASSAAEPDLLPTGYDYIVPERENMTISMNATKLDLDEIRNTVGYQLDGIDLESDELYVWARENIEKSYTGDKLEEYRSRNYFYPSYCEAYYIGSEQVDWAVVLEYNLGLMLSTYSHIALVKNNEIVYLSEVFDFACLWNYSNGQLISMAGEKGLCIFDTEEQKTTYIDKDDSGSPIDVYLYGVAATDENYIIFCSNLENMYIYNRNNGSVKLLSDLYLDPHTDLCRIEKDTLYCCIDYEDMYYAYDLITQEKAALENADISTVVRLESGDYSVYSADNYYHYVTADTIVAERKSDGAQKAFDLSNCWNRAAVDDICSVGDCIYLVGNYEFLALNFETNQAVVISGENPSYFDLQYSADGGAYIAVRDGDCMSAFSLPLRQ